MKVRGTEVRPYTCLRDSLGPSITKLFPLLEAAESHEKKGHYGSEIATSGGDSPVNSAR